MARDNQNLKHLVTDSLQLEPVRSRRQMRKYKLYGIRKRQVVHEPDSTSQPSRPGCIPNTSKGSASRNNLMESFQRLKQSEKKKRVAFAVVPGLQVASVQLTEFTAAQRAPEEPKFIDNLCKLLRSADHSGGTTCVGRMTKEESNFDFYALSRHAYQENDATSLHDLLSQNQGQSMDPSHKLTRKVRLRLAATLASTALQLHTTPWLDSSWNGQEIKFHQGVLSHPYISKQFTKPTRATEPASLGEAPVPAMSPIRNQTLFALGVLLLELSTGKPLDSFKDMDNPIPFEDYIVASRLLQTLSEEESANYFEATRACIFCGFRGSTKDLDLANDAFRQAFYEDVVMPLEEDWRYYCHSAT
ncbi:MAG: hypothetical protein Q9168_005391 [Polycauliona sp. 1 TL-2023]